MYWNRKQVLICTASHCNQKGAQQVAGRFRLEAKRRGIDTDVLINTCDSIDLCDIGPNMLVYPEGVIYSGVAVSDFKDIFEHLEGGPPCARLMLNAETEAEVARRDVYAAMQAAGEGLTEETATGIANEHGFDAAWMQEQYRRGFAARREVDGVMLTQPTTKALQRYRLLPAKDTDQA
jgi:(2Fe-2S) ferredoxin